MQCCATPWGQMLSAGHIPQYCLLLQEIVNTDAVLRDTSQAGGAPFKLVEAWDQLQLQCATYINSDLPGLQAGPMVKPGKPVRCASQGSEEEI